MLTSGCGDPVTGGGPETLDVELSTGAVVPTVLTASWNPPSVSVDATIVESGYGDALDRIVQLGEVDGGQVQLWGFKPSSMVTARVTLLHAGEVVAMGEASVETGAVPTELPRQQVTVRDADEAWNGYLALSPLTISYAVVIDADGDYVWWWRRADVDAERRWIRVAALSHDGQSVVYLAVSAEPEDVGEVVRVSLDGTEVEIHEVDHAHHDMAELPDGTVAVLAEDLRDVDGEIVSGDRIVEVAADGVQTEVFNVWDHFAYDPDVGNDDMGTGWTHANALRHLAGTDQYMISLRNLDAIWTVDRATGEPLWSLGGADSSYELADGGEWFDRQHGVSMVGDEVLVFSNGQIADMESYALGYTLDHETSVATNHWSFGLDPPGFCYAYGDVDHLPDGTALVTWSTTGSMRQVRGDDEVLWELESEFGSGLGYPQPIEASRVETTAVSTGP